MGIIHLRIITLVLTNICLYSLSQCLHFTSSCICWKADMICKKHFQDLSPVKKKKKKVLFQFPDLYSLFMFSFSTNCLYLPKRSLLGDSILSLQVNSNSIYAHLPYHLPPDELCLLKNRELLQLGRNSSGSMSAGNDRRMQD